MTQKPEDPARKKPPKLTARQKLFIAALYADPKQCVWAAAKAAGYKGHNMQTLCATGSRILALPHVRQAVNEMLHAIFASPERVLKRRSRGVLAGQPAPGHRPGATVP